METAYDSPRSLPSPFYCVRSVSIAVQVREANAAGICRVSLFLGINRPVLFGLLPADLGQGSVVQTATLSPDGIRARVFFFFTAFAPFLETCIACLTGILLHCACSSAFDR